ncbi:MAG: type II secretion system GspH family protein [Zoogloeaceae bacterium]|jgi:type II secretory pathway pseudopilin PulG|nr:type II secretion system GspH family protein [Zoogloeaceae bacterium]
MKKQLTGFTLTELAVVLLIVALLIGGMMLPLAAQDDIRRTQDTQRILTEIREALLGFAAAHGRLPRPATSATDGAENPTPCASDAACFGFIPWATLGVAKLDAWDKIIRYSVTPVYASDALTLVAIPNRKVLSRDAGGTLIYLAGQTNACTARQCVPAVIFSQGRRNWGRNDAGIAYGNGSATNQDESANDAGPTDFITRPITDNTAAAGGEFDDLVVWLSPNILFNRMVAAGRLP